MALFQFEITIAFFITFMLSGFPIFAIDTLRAPKRKKIYDYTVCSKTALYASDLYLNYTLKVDFTKWIQWILYFIKAIFNIILEDSIIN